MARHTICLKIKKHTHVDCFSMIYSSSSISFIIVFTCNIGFSSLFLRSTQLQKDCLLCQHIYQMDPVNDSCQ